MTFHTLFLADEVEVGTQERAFLGGYERTS